MHCPAIKQLPNRWLVVGLESEVVLQRFSMALVMVSSATRVTKSIPEERHAERLAASFLCTPTWRARPCVWAAWAMVSSCSGLITSTSKAVERPRLQHGMKMSPGRACKPGVSLEGARAADWAAAWMASCTALWRAMRSLFPPQPTWWSPYASAVRWHSGQWCDELWRGTPSQYRRQHRNSRLWRGWCSASLRHDGGWRTRQGPASGRWELSQGAAGSRPRQRHD